MEGEGDFELINCRTCGRNFRTDVLKKHEPICIKNSKKKRKIFDSGKQRAEGSDIPINKVLKPGEVPKTDPKLAIAEAKTKKWREKHEMLVESFRAARNYAKAKESGGPLPPPLPAVIDSSLVQCPYCQRRFNEDACKRHIPFCKDQQSKIIPRGNNAGAKKTLYKAPLPKPKAEPQQQQKIVVPTTNGTRQRSSPQVSQSSNSRSDSTSVRPARSNGPTSRPAAGRQPPPPSTTATQPTAPSAQPRGSIGGTRAQPTASSAPRGPLTSKKSNVAPAKASSASAGFCHECGSVFALASARFCSECGVRRLAL